MDPELKPPGSPGSPLNLTSPDRVNKQRIGIDMNGSPRAKMFSPERAARESSVFEKAAKFDQLAVQGKPLERRANDAALRRAVLGREEAEEQARRYKEELKQARADAHESKERELKVSRKYETAQENLGRSKETYAHSKAQWEAELRRVRKDYNKEISQGIKYREELKDQRAQIRKLKAEIAEEKERTSEREQEAFTARYQLEGIQSELAAAIQKIKLVEQERDAFKMLAKSEEVARIAAEGQLPLPKSSNDDEFSSPNKEITPPVREVPMLSSLAGEQEIEQLKQMLEWEQSRANRAYDLVDYMKLECRFNTCACCLRKPSSSNKATNSTQAAANSTMRIKSPVDLVEFEHPGRESVQPSTVFIASEGIFRTIPSPSKETRRDQAEERRSRSPQHSKNPSQTRFPVNPQPMAPPSRNSRTPSCDPPNYRNNLVENASIISFADEPSTVLQARPTERRENVTKPAPSTHLHRDADNVSSAAANAPVPTPAVAKRNYEFLKPRLQTTTQTQPQPMIEQVENVRPAVSRNTSSDEQRKVDRSSYMSRASVQRDTHPQPQYHTISTTIRIPLAPEDSDDAPSSASYRYSNSTQATNVTTPNRPLSAMSGMSAHSSTGATFEATVSREEALAMIKERRSRSRSMKEGMATPRKPSTGPAGGMSTGRSARSTSRGRLNRA